MTVVTINPNAGAGLTTVDGTVSRIVGSETFATIRAGAGTVAATSLMSTVIAQAISSGTSNQFSDLWRSIFTFDTSAIPAGATINSAKLGFYSDGFAYTGLGNTNVEACAATPAANNTLAAADYAQLGSVSFGSFAIGSIGGDGAAFEITLNASGRANITPGGISRFGIRLSWDLNNSFTGTWGAGTLTRARAYMADDATRKPYLTVDYTAAAGGSPQNVAVGAVATAQSFGTVTATTPGAGGPITIVGFAGNNASSVAIPAHLPGDLIIASGRGVTTNPGLPSAGGTVPTWIPLQYGAASSVGLTTAYFIATANNHTTGGWGACDNILVIVLRPGAGKTLSTAVARSSTGNAASGTTVTYPALTLGVSDGSSMGVRIGARAFAGSGMTTPPTGWTHGISSIVGAETISLHTRAALTANIAADGVTMTGSYAWRAHTVEVQQLSPSGPPQTVQVGAVYPSGYQPSITGQVICGA